MNKRLNFKVLDHGYVRFVEDWGRGDAGKAEAGIIEAARQSTQGSFRGWERDERLLRFLYTNDPKHATPFEFAGMTIEVQAPIFVFREWHRHRTQSYNEMSARYAPLPDYNYVPTIERIMRGGGGGHVVSNKQASSVEGARPLTLARARAYRNRLIRNYLVDERNYQRALMDGIPKELARCELPVGRYSRMRATANLRNWLAFLTLRHDPGAQWEIQQFAHEVDKIIYFRFPRVWSLFNEERTAKLKAKLDRKVA